MSIYLDHFGLQFAPFRITPATQHFFPGCNRGETLTALLYAIESGEGLIKVIGEVGSGKTMLSRMLIEQLPENVDTVYIVTPTLSQEGVLHTLVRELDISPRTGGALLPDLQEALIARYRQKRPVVVVIDEAHAMPVETLEQIRLLSNLEASDRKLLQIVLFGQPELDEILQTRELRPLRERITHSLALSPFSPADVRAYIEFRLHCAGYRGHPIFSDIAVKLIAHASGGLTRRINILADKALLGCFAAGKHQVDKEIAQRAIAECHYEVKKAQTPRQRLLAQALALLCVLGIGGVLGWMLAAQAPNSASATSSPPPALTPPASAAASASPPPESPLPRAHPAKITPALPFTLQIGYGVNIKELAAREAVALRHYSKDDILQIPGRLGDQAVVILCVGRYPTLAAARAALAAQPPELSRYSPQIRTLATLGQ